jgi:hypothetical protein
MPPAPVYPKCVYGHSATEPRVMNPAFHFVSGRVFSAPRTFVRQFPRAVVASLHVCMYVGYVRTVRIRVGLSHSRLAERYTGENKQSCHQPPFRLGILSPNRRKLSGNDSVTV